MKRWLLPVLFPLVVASAHASPRVLRRWLINEQGRVLQAEQVEVAPGQEETRYSDEAGNPLPESFCKARQISWRSTSVAIAASMTTAPDKIQRAKVASVSAAAGLTNRSARVSLSGVDVAALEAEDAVTRAAGDKPRRIGIRRSLSGLVTDPSVGKWFSLPGGQRVYLALIQSAGAQAIRLHLEGIHLPPGGCFWVFNADQPSEVHGPYDESFLNGATDLWTESVFGANVVLECVLPAGAAPSTARFSISEVGHVYARLDPSNRKAAGYCENDAMCFPDWYSTANGVAGLGSVGQRGLLFCTGCLLNDLDASTQASYFMTAFHCLDDNAGEASTLEFYWFYQAASCNGAAPSAASVPRTGGGADFLAAQNDQTGNDFCFLRLRQSPPGGVTYNGWSSETPDGAQTIAGIHHPDGDFKRISFGHWQGFDGDFHVIQWFSGVTEPGSSGSPIFDSNKRFIGQLNGGFSDCADLSGLDYYGRFDISYPIIRSYLSPTIAQVFLSSDRRDFDGDGRTDIAVFHPDTGNWYVRRSSNGQLFLQNWGWSAVKPTPGDFDGDGVTDIAVYFPGTGTWYIRRSSNGQLLQQQWGWSEALPVPGKFDSDSITDMAVYHPGTGTWYIRRSTDGQLLQQQWGWSEASPVSGDFDGDGRTDIGVYYAGTWYIRRSSNSQLLQVSLGGGDTQAAPADFDGDGITDFAVYQASTGNWTIRQSSNGQTNTQNWGWSATFPAPGRYDADAKSDIAVYHQAAGDWYIRQSNSGNALLKQNWGWNAANPVR